jgi:hypothetical protein
MEEVGMSSKHSLTPSPLCILKDSLCNIDFDERRFDRMRQ